MLHVRTTCTKKQWPPSGLVFDSMLSEWLISQCFDLLQLLELCLVRAWIWHTLQIIMWLHYIQCFFFFQFFLLKHFYVESIKSFDTTHAYFTPSWVHFTIRRLLNLKQKKMQLYFCNFCMDIIDLLWLSLFFFCTESTVWLQRTLWIFHRCLELLFWNMNHVGAQNHVDKLHFPVTGFFISLTVCAFIVWFPVSRVQSCRSSCRHR